MGNCTNYTIEIGAKGRNCAKCIISVDEGQMYVIELKCWAVVLKRPFFMANQGVETDPFRLVHMKKSIKKELALDCCIDLLHQSRANSHQSCYLTSV